MQKESTYDLLKRWLRGDVGYKEEQQLNEQASSDPFLADALDGYRSLPGADHDEQLKALKARLQENRRSRKGGIYWMRIAASVLVLVVALVAFWMINQSPEELKTTQNELSVDAKQKQEEKEAVAEFDEAPSETPAAIETEEAPSEALETIAREEVVSKPNEKAISPAPPPPSPIQRKIVIADDTSLSDTGGQEPIAMVEEELFEEANVMVSDTYKDKGEVSPQKESAPIAYDDEVDAIVLKPEAKRAASAPSFYQFTISGKVIDGNTSEPLIGASVIREGTSQGAVTDLDGNFVLSVPVDTTAVELVVSYTGYAQKSVEARLGEEVLIWLDEGGLTLSEVTVSGRSGAKRDKKRKETEVAPKKGFDEYASYIKNNLNYPDAAKDAGIKGQVVLSFYIGNNGPPR